MSISAVAGARVAGLVAGLCAVAIVTLAAWRMPATAPPAPVAVQLGAVSSGAVGAEAGPGTVRVRNRTAGRIAVRPRVTGGDRSLDALVRVELAAAGRTAFRGRLGTLRDQGPVVVALAPGAEAVVAVRAWAPGDAGVEGGWALVFEEAR